VGKYLPFLFLVVLLFACSPSEEAIQAAIQATMGAMPTDTSVPTISPTTTPIPTDTPAPTTTPLPERFTRSVEEFLEKASRLNAATKQGVNYADFNRYLDDVIGAYDLMKSL
jgi:hypothetical protein